MKFLIIKLKLLLVLIAAAGFAKGQMLITKHDTISLEQDSVILLVLPEHRGQVKWQKSLDNTNWLDIEGETNDTLIFKVEDEVTLRAAVYEGNCPPYFSDTVSVLYNEAIAGNYVDYSPINSLLIESSFNDAAGKYRLHKTNETESFKIGNVFVDPGRGIVCKIVDIHYYNDSIVLITNQGVMEDVFIDCEFKLSTEPMTVNPSLKKASLKQIQQALTDDDGFIHPIKIEYITKTGKILKSGLNILEEGDTAIWGDVLYKMYDFSGYDLLYLTGEEDLSQNKYTNGVANPDYNYDKNYDFRLFVSEGYFEIDPVFKFEFNFERPKIDWEDFKINTGQLKKFSFYSDSSKFELKTMLKLEANYTINKEVLKTLIDDLVSYRFTFLVSGVPVSLDVEIDIMNKTSTEVSGFMNAETGFKSTRYITSGITYENNQWNTFSKYEKTDEYYELKTDGEIVIDHRFEMYPRCDFSIWEVFTTYLEVVPFMENKFGFSSSLNRHVSSLAGVDARIGAEVKVGETPIFTSPQYNSNLYQNYLYRSPDKLAVVSGDAQTTIPGNELNDEIVVQVWDNLNNPVKNLPVYFSTGYDVITGTVLNNMVLTDVNGIAKNRWILGDQTGKQNLSIFLKNGKDEKIDGLETTISASAVYEKARIQFHDAVSGITANSAVCGVVVSDDGGSAVTARGVCWSKSPNPGVDSENKTLNGFGTGSFISTITNLQPNTTYYVKAYATNSAGTAYSENELEFKTLPVGPEITAPDNKAVFNTNVTKAVTFQWDNVNAADEYWLKVFPRGGDELPVFDASVGNTTARTIAIDGFDNGIFSFQVRARAGGQWSNYSAAREFIADTPATAPGMISPQHEAFVTRDSQQVFSWSAPPGAIARYYVRIVSGTDMQAEPVYESESTTTSLNINCTWEPGLYTWSVRAMKETPEGYSEADYEAAVGWGNYGPAQTFTIAEPVSLPAVTTTAVSGITSTTAISGGQVTSGGGAPVTARGVCWSTSPDPDAVTSDKTVDGSGTGEFTSTITGLTPGTPYYVMAWATNSKGTGYGKQVTFTTQADEQTSGTFTDSRDGNTYKWVKIGEQVWMAENLAYLPEIHVPDGQSRYHDTVPVYYVYGYNGADVNQAKATANYFTYGVLYNYVAALEACPDGWHLASAAEWGQLAQYISDTKGPYATYNSNFENRSVHLKATSGWINNGNGTDDFGFSAMPGGQYWYSGASNSAQFGGIGDSGYWWSDTRSWVMYNFTKTLYGPALARGDSQNIRCIKD